MQICTCKVLVLTSHLFDRLSQTSNSGSIVTRGTKSEGMTVPEDDPLCECPSRSIMFERYLANGRVFIRRQLYYEKQTIFEDDEQLDQTNTNALLLIFEHLLVIYENGWFSQQNCKSTYRASFSGTFFFHLTLSSL